MDGWMDGWREGWMDGWVLVGSRDYLNMSDSESEGPLWRVSIELGCGEFQAKTCFVSVPCQPLPALPAGLGPLEPVAYPCYLDTFNTLGRPF